MESEGMIVHDMTHIHRKFCKPSKSENESFKAGNATNVSSSEYHL